MPNAASPLVSVVMPAHNDARFLGDSLRSVLAQRYRHMEVLVVDDGSTDDSAAVARAFGDPVRVIVQPNSGSAVARSRAMAESRGELIAFLDADDYWHPDKLALQVAHLERHPALGGVYASWLDWMWPDQPDPEAVFAAAPAAGDDAIDPALSGWLYAELLLDCVMHTSSVVLRRDVVEKVGAFDASLRKGQDYDYWLRCSRVAPFAKLRRALSLYRIRRDSITGRVVAQNYGAAILEGALAKWGATGPDGRRPPFVELARTRAQRWSSFGWLQFDARNHSGAFDAALRSLRRWPLHAPALKLAARSGAALLLGGRAPA